MHMADTLISPFIGTSMWSASGGLFAYSSKKLTSEKLDIPLMAAAGSLVFAAQMINFQIPLTGSSGHLGGGLLLSILLGPHAAFITMAFILLIQCFFFADGGILALGANLFNLGFYPCFIAYPLVYKKIAGKNPTKSRLFLSTILASILALQLGALSVVIETLLSGITDLRISQFLLLMLPIHLPIAIIEGFITSLIIIFFFEFLPETKIKHYTSDGRFPIHRKKITFLFLLSLFLAVFASAFSSILPDGLEWSISKSLINNKLSEQENKIYNFTNSLQQKTAIFPDYSLKTLSEESTSKATYPSFNLGLSAAGFIGVILSFFLIAIFAKFINFISQKTSQPK